jgi:ferredoxin-NADP reductase/predicted pyridoxine 5'-phosphate oxidase superfamily flavin-nucleotide-binding protein
MGRAFSDIAFTPQVRDIQSQKGSRGQYAHLDEMSDRGDRLSGREIEFIKHADHFYQATVSETGWPYVQHRGGPAGFLKVIDDKTLGFTDFVGNVQYISVGNLKKDDRIALIFMDYANQRRLKLLGRAHTVELADDPALAENLRTPGYDGRIERAFIIVVEGFDWNCPQHITPRFTEEQIASMTAPLRSQVQHLKAQLTKATTSKLPDELGDGELALKITGVRQLTKTIRAYELRDVNGQQLPDFKAGAHLDVPVRLADGSLGTRCYSITSNPLHRNVYEIAVLREDRGTGGSKSVHEEFRMDLILHCSLPKNHFPLDDKASRVILIAGGIGITPIRSMAYEAQARGQDFELHYAIKSRSDAAYLEQLEIEFGKKLTTYAADAEGRLNVQALLSNDLVGQQFYICGPARLIETAVQTAQQLGLDASRVRYERFNKLVDQGANHAVTVTLAKSGKVLNVPATSSILDVIQQAGVNAPASCRTGNCGMCAVKVLEGNPDHRDEALSKAQREGEKLMCICVSRATGNTLTLDL